MKQNFDCTFIPSDLSELSAWSELDPATLLMLMSWCDAGEEPLHDSNTIGSGDQNISLLVQDVLSSTAAPAALHWFSNFKIPVSAFQIELFLPQSETHNTGPTLFSYIQVNTSFYYCVLFQQQEKVFYNNRVIVNKGASSAQLYMHTPTLQMFGL